MLYHRYVPHQHYSYYSTSSDQTSILASRPSILTSHTTIVMPEIKFVLVHDDRIHTRRSKELQDASIKSHAARKAARRRKRQQLKNAEPSTDNDQRQASWEIRRLDSPTSLLGGGNRDPFVSYPGALFPSIVLEAQDFSTLILQRSRSHA